MDNQPTAAPGWYIDPQNKSQLRWWDGSRWFDHVAPMPDAPVVSAIETPALGQKPTAIADLATVHPGVES